MVSFSIRTIPLSPYGNGKYMFKGGPQATLPQAHRREVLAKILSSPHRAGAAASGTAGKVIIVNSSTYQTRWLTRKRFPCEQRRDLRRSLQKAQHQLGKPGIVLIVGQGREPHL